MTSVSLPTSSCPFCGASAGLPSPGMYCVCVSCGYVVRAGTDALHAVPREDIPAQFNARLTALRRRIVEARRQQGFVAPGRCPTCTSPLQAEGLLPRGRVVCPGCLDLFVAEDGTLRPPRPGELHPIEEEMIADIRASRLPRGEPS